MQHCTSLIHWRANHLFFMSFHACRNSVYYCYFMLLLNLIEAKYYSVSIEGWKAQREPTQMVAHCTKQAASVYVVVVQLRLLTWIFVSCLGSLIKGLFCDVPTLLVLKHTGRVSNLVYSKYIYVLHKSNWILEQVRLTGPWVPGPRPRINNSKRVEKTQIL